MTKQELDNLIIGNINTNDAGLITGLVLQQVLLSMTNFTDEQVTAILAQLHSHSNKQYLDLIQEKDINVLSRLSIVNGNLQIDGNAYSTGELSAYGMGSGGSSGGGVDLLQAWTDYDSTKANWAVKAGLLVPFYDDTRSRLASLEGGAALSLSTVGTGNGIASITKSGTVLTVAKANFAELDSSGKVLSSQLPSYVDDVIEATSLLAFPPTGESGKIYIAQDTNRTYRWSGTDYVEISASLALGETSSTAYRGDRGKIAYDHSQTEHQAIINGTGFVKANGKTLSYDNNSYSLASHNHSGIYEPVLGNPTANGYLLSSTTDGARSWVAPYSLPTASASVLGGVKIGANVSIANGVISVHNPLTIGTANGLSLSTQVLSLALATTASNGALSSTDKAYIDLLKTFFEYDSANNAIKALKSLYSIGEISAYGLGTGGSGGGGVDKLDSWANYTEAKADYYVPASLLVPFRSDTLSRLDSLENGSATSIETTGSGNAITSVSKSGNTLTFAKGSTFSLSTHNHDTVYKPIGYVPSWSEITGKPSTFAPSAHTHTIANVTGLQAALDGKSATGHTHPISSITDLQATLNGKASLRTRSSMSDSYRRFVIGVIRLDGGANAYSRAFGVITMSRVNGLFPSKRFDFSIQKKYSVEEFTGNVFRYNSFNTFRLCKFLYNGVLYGGFDIYVQSANITYIDFIGQSPEWVVVEYYNTSSNTVINSEIYNSLVEMNYEAGSFYANGDTIYTSGNLTSLSQLTDNIGVATHIANTSNPHNVTKAQVGLGNVDNTADSAKNVLSATKLTTARTIAGVSFDGSANIAIPFANLSSKPTTLGGYGITDAVTLNTAQTITGAKAFTGDVGIGNTSPTEKLDVTGNIRLSGGANGRYLTLTNAGAVRFTAGTSGWANGLSYELNDGTSLGSSAGAYGSSTGLSYYFYGGTYLDPSVVILPNKNVGIGTTNPLYKLDVAGAGRFTGNLTASAGVNTPKVDFGNGFTIEPSGTELVFKYNGVIKQRMLSDGTILATGEVTAFGSTS